MLQHMVADSFSRRLDLALTAAQIPPGRNRRKLVAEMFNVSTEAVRKWLAEENTPSSKRLQEMAQKLNVDFDWLATGRGDMRLAFREESSTYLTSERRDLLFYFDQLTPEQRDKTLDDIKRRSDKNYHLYQELSKIQKHLTKR